MPPIPPLPLPLVDWAEVEDQPSSPLLMVPAALSWVPTHPSKQPEEAILASKDAESRLIGLILERAGCPQSEIAKRLGITPQALNQYVKSRKRASFHWIVRLAQVCGARLTLSFPNLADPILLKASQNS